MPGANATTLVRNICLDTFNHLSTPPAQENVDSLCGSFVIPFERDGARTLDECNDKEYMKWMLQTDGLPGSEALFCQAVKAWLDKEDKRRANIIADRRARRTANGGVLPPRQPVQVKREENEEETLVNNQEGSPDLINAFSRAQRTTASSSRAVVDISNRTPTKRYRNVGVSAAGGTSEDEMEVSPSKRSCRGEGSRRGEVLKYERRLSCLPYIPSSSMSYHIHYISRTFVLPGADCGLIFQSLYCILSLNMTLLAYVNQCFAQGELRALSEAYKFWFRVLLSLPSHILQYSRNLPIDYPIILENALVFPQKTEPAWFSSKDAGGMKMYTSGAQHDKPFNKLSESYIHLARDFLFKETGYILHGIKSIIKSHAGDFIIPYGSRAGQTLNEFGLDEEALEFYFLEQSEKMIAKYAPCLSIPCSLFTSAVSEYVGNHKKRTTLRDLRILYALKVVLDGASDNGAPEAKQKV
ncbi:hypothetical protein M422DRAFT_42814 [Sphaerobolus stellatus SS14]|nr:hypothetical protein M422DRAFT_42814 [Sphaerobolus stellatus SS14]